MAEWGVRMKQALVALIVGTVLSGLAAAYATTVHPNDRAPLKAVIADSKASLAGSD